MLSYNLILSGLMMSKVEDLSRMFRLFSKIPRGLDPVSSIFKQVSSFQLGLHPLLFQLKGVLCVFLSLSLKDFLCYSLMQHVTAEGTALVKLAEDAASNKKVFALIFPPSLFHFFPLYSERFIFHLYITKGQNATLISSTKE